MEVNGRVARNNYDGSSTPVLMRRYSCALVLVG